MKVRIGRIVRRNKYHLLGAVSVIGGIVVVFGVAEFWHLLCAIGAEQLLVKVTESITLAEDV